MSKLEHVKLQFNAHEMECLNNGGSTLGIQHLSSLNKVEIKINGGRDLYNESYNPAEDDTVRCISRAINASIETLPNRPTVKFVIANEDCVHFKSILREWSQDYGGLLNEWLELWQIREEQANQAIDGETELEDEAHENEEEEQTAKEEQTGEKEVARQEDSDSRN